MKLECHKNPNKPFGMIAQTNQNSKEFLDF